MNYQKKYFPVHIRQPFQRFCGKQNRMRGLPQTLLLIAAINSSQKFEMDKVENQSNSR